MKATQDLTGNQLAQKIIDGMSRKQLERLVHVTALMESGQDALASLYLRNLPAKDKVKIVGYYAALAEGNDIAGI